MPPWTTTPTPAALAEQRRSIRHAPAQTGTHVWLDDVRSMQVEVLDESENGIGVLLRDTSFAFGPRVDVDYCGKRRSARVAYLARVEDENFRLGLEWI